MAFKGSWRLTSLALALALAACMPLERRQTPDRLRQAQTLATMGKHQQAAAQYLSAAEHLPPPERSHYLLRAAQALYLAGDREGMQLILAKLDPGRMSLPDRIALAFLKARLALDQDDPTTAQDLLNTLDLHHLPAHLRKDYHQLRARVLALQGDLVGSLRARINLARWLKTLKEVEENNRAILQALELIPPDVLKGIKARPRSDLAGWIELAQLFKAHPYRSQALDLALEQWRQTYPYHPADQGRFLERLIARRLPQPPSYSVPQTLALLLPHSGPFQAAADVIRHAIESVRRLPSETYHPQLTEYDSTAADPVLQYQRAGGQGAELIIGPLQKPELERLARLERFHPPLLALNAIDGLTRPGLYQLALPPEEGVAQVADSAFAHGHLRALVMVPATQAGDRIANFFLSYWERLGGRVLEIQRYPPNGDVSSAIRRLLNLDESERRFERLRQFVWEAKFTARVRRDADFLFLHASPEQGRLIKPQLIFYRAEYLPVYATWDIYTGHPDPSQDRDLEGIRFCDLPWLLKGEHETAPTVADFEMQWGPHPGAYLRLAALGMDAYRIPARLLGIGGRYAGVSGLLTLDGAGRIQRQLTCAEFRQGVPVIYGLAPEASHVQKPSLRPQS